MLLLLLGLGACQNGPKPSGPVNSDSYFAEEDLTPVRIVCTSGPVENADHLLETYVGQVSTDEPAYTTFKKGG